MAEQAIIMEELYYNLWRDEECPNGRRRCLEKESYCWKWPVYATISSIDKKEN